MPDSNRGQKLAFGIGLVLMLAIVMVITALTQPVEANNAGNTARDSANHQETQTELNADPQPSVPVAVQNNLRRIARALEAANNKQQSPAERANAKRDLQAQERMAFWASLMFGVGLAEILLTGAGVLLVWRTLVHTRRAADAAHDAVAETKRIGEAQTRAYLTSLDGTFIAFKEIINCWPAIKNTGQSPANNIKIVATLRYVYETQTFESAPVHGTAPPIPSGGADVGTISFAIQDETVMEAIRREDAYFTVSGVITWEDVFGTPNTIAFSLLKETTTNSYGDGISNIGMESCGLSIATSKSTRKTDTPLMATLRIPRRRLAF